MVVLYISFMLTGLFLFTELFEFGGQLIEFDVLLFIFFVLVNQQEGKFFNLFEQDLRY